MNGRTGDQWVRGLSPAEAVSLAEALRAAAISATSDPVLGVVVVPRAGNRFFDATHIESVVRDWSAGATGRKAALTAVERDDSHPTAGRAALIQTFARTAASVTKQAARTRGTKPKPGSLLVTRATRRAPLSEPQLGRPHPRRD